MKLMNLENEEFDETTLRSAYSEAMKLRRQGLDNEIVYARMEKQGYPEALIVRVLKNITAERRKRHIEKSKINYNIAAIKVSAGIVLVVVSSFLFPGIVIVPIGFILGGILLAIVTKNEQDSHR